MLIYLIFLFIYGIIYQYIYVFAKGLDKVKENFLMTMITHQLIEGEKEVIEMTSLASFEGNADDYSITYCDEDGDLKGCKTTLHVEKGSMVTIRREGDYSSHIIVEKNARHISHHVTPYGTFAMGVSALDVDSKMTEKGGKLSFRYSTDMDMRPIGEIQFDITVKERNLNF